MYEREEGTEVPVSQSSSDYCLHTGVKPANDMGETLDMWMAVVGGQVVDVAANGQCGWLAFLAAKENIAEGFIGLTPEVVKAGMDFKKQMINCMLTTLTKEADLEPQEFEVELQASGLATDAHTSFEQSCSLLAQHYVAQRKKSVKTNVQGKYWFRTAQLKAMAKHARLPIFVLDVDGNNMARMQVYTYRKVTTRVGGDVEIGVVHSAPTQKALALV
ncbi:hypothetical protein PHMEG_00021548 [Phytophthora megakarya]|uniref:Uncharacterized protein n=1 Tax=Phytophthora megakarya TaxID=4795 RepID=A0A225VMI1_9STRA|nr:hypothetical protein PHMEG_00021548 [Phytophthora megakarya]